MTALTGCFAHDPTAARSRRSLGRRPVRNRGRVPQIRPVGRARAGRRRGGRPQGPRPVAHSRPIWHAARPEDRRTGRPSPRGRAPASWPSTRATASPIPAIDLAIAELPAVARGQGVAAAPIRNSNHCGAAGLHVERLAEEGTRRPAVRQHARGDRPLGRPQGGVRHQPHRLRRARCRDARRPSWTSRCRRSPAARSSGQAARRSDSRRMGAGSGRPPHDRRFRRARRDDDRHGRRQGCGAGLHGRGAGGRARGRANSLPRRRRSSTTRAARPAPGSFSWPSTRPRSPGPRPSPSA